MAAGRGVVLAVVSALVLGAPAARAHDAWSDGSPIPEWVKRHCCGEADAHHLQPGDVSEDAEGYHVRGYPWPIPKDRALPSQDGEYWLFYPTYWNDYGDRAKHDGLPRCFFIPLGA